ncbi:MAG: beta-phosphoglucomutase [Firmicutes bacterium]|nr:beta-phosphoglucomutase [Bacillota bacterium]
MGGREAQDQPCALRRADLVTASASKSASAIEAAIFDLDGVIVDTAKYHYMAWKRLANKLGFDFSPEDNERLKGVSRMRSLEILLEIAGLRLDEQSKAELAERKNRWYIEYISRLSPSEILPGVPEFIGGLRRLGMKTALASASKNAPIILENLGITSLFDAIVDGNTASRAKPDPQVFLLAAGRLGVDPCQCIVFEDAAAGVEAAHRAGMYAVGVGSPEVLRQADHVIPGFAGLDPAVILELASRRQTRCRAQ